MIQTRHLHGFPWARDGTVCDGLCTKEGGWVMWKILQLFEFVSLIFHPFPPWGSLGNQQESYNFGTIAIKRFHLQNKWPRTVLRNRSATTNHHPSNSNPSIVTSCSSLFKCPMSWPTQNRTILCPQKWLCYDSTCNFGGSPCVGFFSCWPNSESEKSAWQNPELKHVDTCWNYVPWFAYVLQIPLCALTAVWPRHGEFHRCPSRSGMHLNGMQNWHLESLLILFEALQIFFQSLLSSIGLP